jgi:glycerate 2-kinase
MKALIAIDSFKGCLTSEEAGLAAASAFGAGECEVVPVSDGGEGFSKIVTSGLGGETVSVSCHDPLGRIIKAGYGLVGDGSVAVIETAAAGGLGLLRKDELDPAVASSYGTGELIVDALGRGAREIWIGLGGSATCDGGTGLLRALGYRFYSGDCEITDPNPVLCDITGIDSSRRNSLLDECRIVGFYDVSVPFCGEGGAARVFAPQKGASPELVEELDRGMSRFASLAGGDILDCPGAGAAGGIGGAVHRFLGAEMRRGISAVLDIFSLEEKLSGCGIVVTGEGSADSQTLGGKVPLGVLEYVKSRSAAKVVLLAGQVRDRDALLAAGFDAVVQVTPEGMPLEEALRPEVARANITRAVSGLLDSR